MNNISLPDHDDFSAFSELAKNKSLESYPFLKRFINTVETNYYYYLIAGGDPTFIPEQLIFSRRRKFLKGHYKSPPKGLSFIKDLRKKNRHLVCPMCGSMHRGTLDHYLPQSLYPIFSLFSLNLVPACLCNSQRGDILIGASIEERVLHPYFDQCLSERLIKAKFEDLGAVPSVGVVLAVSKSHSDYASIAFHFREIVQKTGIQGYLADRWSDLIRKPSLVIRALAINIIDPCQLNDELIKELSLLDDQFRGKNNWNSVFIAGLLDPPVTAWLLTRLSIPGRIPDSPLV